MANPMNSIRFDEKRASATGKTIATGIPGLDDVLNGGLAPDRLYLIEGSPGTGKTTLGMQFLLAGRDDGERGLYITLSESRAELTAVAASHGWSLDGVDIFELVTDEEYSPTSEQTILHPEELELGEAMRHVVETIDALAPSRIVFDGLSEMRLLAQSPQRYRRQILLLKQYLSTRNCTVLFLDDKTASPGELQLHSVAHGVISLEQWVHDFGPERRRLCVVKMRGAKYRGGYHDCALERGGMRIFPRLVAAEHHTFFDAEPQGTGLSKLDEMLGGGLTPGTNTLFTGPSGVGKTTTAIHCVLAALERGQRVVYYLFDEGIGTLVSRCAALGLDISRHLASQALLLQRIDPAELSPGEFASRVRKAVEQDVASFVVIDSLNAYIKAMPGERYLILQMHELLSYLNQQGVITLMIVGLHGPLGNERPDIDLSYLSDAVLMFRFFEAQGEIMGAVSAVKSRTTPHLRTIHEFRITSGGLQVGDALRDFERVLSGLPSYTGDMPMLHALDSTLETGR
jgi:circadian clock protein KaiC